jgi:hypothetical protein
MTLQQQIDEIRDQQIEGVLRENMSVVRDIKRLAMMCVTQDIVVPRWELLLREISSDIQAATTYAATVDTLRALEQLRDCLEARLAEGKADA